VAVSIVLDKPFVIGDFIVVDAHSGTVEYRGVKSTRIGSIDGELMVFSALDGPVRWITRLAGFPTVLVVY